MSRVGLDVRPVLVGTAVPHVRAAVRLGGGDDLVRKIDLDAVLRALRGPRRLAELDVARRRARGEDQRVGPAEHPLVPEAHVRRHRLEDRAAVRARAHEIPEVDVGVAGARRVVQVRQAEVVAVLVGEDADAGVLGLHDVVRDLDVRAGNLVSRRGWSRSAPRWRRRPVRRRHRTCPRPSARARGGRRCRRARGRCRHRRRRPGPRCRSPPRGSSDGRRPAR